MFSALHASTMQASTSRAAPSKRRVVVAAVEGERGGREG